MNTTKAFGILLRTGRNLKVQQVPRDRRRKLLTAMIHTLVSFPLNRRKIAKQPQGVFPEL